MVLDVLRDCGGVIEARLLTNEEKKSVSHVEEKAEEKIAYGMCKTVNKGVREALSMHNTAGLVIDSSVFEYPHHPGMKMLYEDTIVGEQVKDKARVEELKKNRANFFLWDEFVLYMSKLPRGAEERKKLRMVYVERPATQLEGHPCVLRSVLGTPSTDGDLLVKELLSARNDKPTIGTCLVGFELKESPTS
jgi:hypothetical protein